MIATLLAAAPAARTMPVSIDLTPQKTGEVRYAYGMGMIGGGLAVQ